MNDYNPPNPTYTVYKSIADDFEAAAKVINEYVYLCVVPEMATRSIQEMKLYGTRRDIGGPMNGKVPNRLVTVMITIRRMTELFNEGFSFTIADTGKLKEIFTNMKKYLIAWRDLQNQAVNTQEHDIEFLLALDSMVQKLFPDVYAQVKDYEVKSNISTVLQKNNKLQPVFKTPMNRFIAGTGTASGVGMGTNNLQGGVVVDTLEKKQSDLSIANYIVDTLGRS